MGLKSELIHYSRKCYRNNFVKATDGNLSARNKKNLIISTAANTCKGIITLRDIIKTDIEGKRTESRKQPSSELKLHLYIYKKRKEINAVIHTHPVFCSAFACSGLSLEKTVLPEIYLKLGRIPLAEYATPSTDEVPDSIAGLVMEHNAILLSNHGLVTMGKTIEEAYYLTEKAEQFAGISFFSRMLGGEKELSEAAIKKLDLLKNN
jgi:L-fuculose-phosphate aldolase